MTEAEARACRTETAVKAASSVVRTQAIDDCIKELKHHHDLLGAGMTDVIASRLEALKGSGENLEAT